MAAAAMSSTQHERTTMVDYVNRSIDARSGALRRAQEHRLVKKLPASTLNDPARLSVLRALAILDTPAEPAYDVSELWECRGCGELRR